LAQEGPSEVVDIFINFQSSKGNLAMGLLSTAGALASLQGALAAVPVANDASLLFPPEADFLVAMDFVPYPSYSGNLAVAGEVQIAQKGTGSDAAQVMSFVLTGADPSCGTANISGIGNACGIHIHEGTSCSNASTIGGHFWNKTAFEIDPWASIIYNNSSGTASADKLQVTTGLTNVEVADRVIVVHDATGARIACTSMVSEGIVKYSDKASAGSLIANNFQPYPEYSGNLSATGEVLFEVAADGPEAAQVMSYRLTGTDPLCGSANVSGVANACGIHIHKGTSCSNASTIGGHFWNETAISTDPWAPVMYTTVAVNFDNSYMKDLAAADDVKVVTGLSNAEVADRVVVLHDVTGARVACSPMTLIAVAPESSTTSMPTTGEPGQLSAARTSTAATSALMLAALIGAFSALR